MSPIAPRIVESAAALVIGGEILSGKIRDDNSYFLAKALRALGVRLEQVVVVPDELPRIVDELQRLTARADVIFTSGGVGPTHDDVTIDAVAAALGVDVVEDDRLLELLLAHYGSELSDAHRRMARVPAGSQLVSGQDIRWPTIVSAGIWLLPGIPELFRMKLAVLREHLRGPQPFYSEYVLSSAEEADIKPELDRVVAHHPNVEVGSYPKWFDPRFKTRITFDSRSEGESRAAASEMRELLGGRVVDLAG